MDKFISDLHPNNLRYLFYLVTPNETTFDHIQDIPNYTDKATIWMLLLILLEFALDREHYAFNDSITSINAGMFSLLFKFSGRYLSAYLYESVYNSIHLVDLPINHPGTWILCFFTQDLMYYLGHRAIHEAGVFWSFHQMHHSSEYYNLSTALRQGAIQDIGMASFDLLQSIAIPPPIFIVHRYLNVLYQFWLHTQAVPYLGPLEYFLNTPSSHRVHHGRNPYCIDRNYGGTLIIWDRLFGTYEPERPDVKIAYGLVTPINTFDQMHCQFFEFKEIGYDKPHMKDVKGEDVFSGVWNKFKAIFGPPGYFPGVRTKQFFWWRCNENNLEGIPEVEEPIKVFNPSLSVPLRIYLFVQFILLVGAGLAFNEVRATHSWLIFLLEIGVLLSWMQMFGYYFDHRSFCVHFDLLRLLFNASMALVVENNTRFVIALVSTCVVILLQIGRQVPVSGKTKTA